MREIDQAGVRFIVPLRASAGFRERFLADVGHQALRPVRYAPERESKLPASNRTRFKGALRDWDIPGSDTHPPLGLRVAYIHSSEEATQVAEARERALVKAEDALERMRNGFGGRYYKTQAQVERRIGQILGVNITRPDRRDGHHPPGQADRDLAAQPGRDRHGRVVRRDLRARDEPARPDHRRQGPAPLQGPTDRGTPPPRHEANVEGPPIFLHNDDRVHALISIVGLSLLIFGLIEAQTRAAIGAGQQLSGLLPEGRAAKPTGRNILAAFQGLGLTYTHTGIQLDQLTPTQQQILELLEIQPPWPTQQDHALTSRGKWG